MTIKKKPPAPLFPIGARVALIESGATGCVVKHVKASRDDYPAKKAHRVLWDASGSQSYVRPNRLRASYMVCDERGTELVVGMDEPSARERAQVLANSLDECVLLYGPTDTAETATRVEPKVDVPEPRIPAEGTYRLTADITNPTPLDVGVSWISRPVFPAGLLVQLKHKLRAKEAYFEDPKGQGHVDEYDARFDAIKGHLEPVVETPSLYLARTHAVGRAVAILDDLVASGAITLADVHRAACTGRLGRKA